VRVADTGVGIGAGERERIFEPYMRAEREARAGVEGTGLGLAISRNFARGMGGDLTVDSALGGGSTFTLALPRAG
jgi:signal transduction histidine kinase